MKLAIDIEANSLINPTAIWLIVCKDIDTNEYYIFRNVTTDEVQRNKFAELYKSVDGWIGHNLLEYDVPNLSRLIGVPSVDPAKCIDTLILSRLVDYSRPTGHSIESYGQEFGLEKEKFNDWTKYSAEMESYCIRDVDICHKIYLKYLRVINDPTWKPASLLEHRFQLVVNALHNNGFCFNTRAANVLREKVTKELETLDKEILNAFKPKLKAIKEVHPSLTKFGSINKKDFRFVTNGDLSEYNGGPFTRCHWVSFNPGSHKQIVDVLANASWSPVEKTQTHIDTERELNRLKYSKGNAKDLDIQKDLLYTKLLTMKKTGWKINETNLATLPPDAPLPARTLAKRILVESRRRTLTEWLSLCAEDNRIHGKFYGIGAWTHRMAHQQPNTANIPTDVKLYGNEMRSLWRAPPRRLLVGVDAEGIQLRIFAHYIDDKQFTKALVDGKKDKGTDPHNLNKAILGPVCKSRQDAKRFIYALLLGAGIGKLAQVLGCREEEAQEALDRLIKRYSGFDYLRRKVIPADAKRGYFEGLDGRRVRIPGDTAGTRRHLCMSGYLQNGEAICMKMATLRWHDRLKDFNSKLVDMVHDEWQTETPQDMATAIQVAEIQSRSLREVGEELKLKCPLAGSYWNEDKHDYNIGTNWSVTHG